MLILFVWKEGSQSFQNKAKKAGKRTSLHPALTFLLYVLPTHACKILCGQSGHVLTKDEGLPSHGLLLNGKKAEKGTVQLVGKKEINYESLKSKTYTPTVEVACWGRVNFPN